MCVEECANVKCAAGTASTACTGDSTMQMRNCCPVCVAPPKEVPPPVVQCVASSTLRAPCTDNCGCTNGVWGCRVIPDCKVATVETRLNVKTDPSIPDEQLVQKLKSEFAKAGASTNTLDQTQITIVKSDTATGQREIVVKSSFEGTDTATGLPIAVDSKAAQTRALSTVANSDSVSAADLVSDMNETITASGVASNVVASLVVVLVVVLNL